MAKIHNLFFPEKIHNLVAGNNSIRQRTMAGNSPRNSPPPPNKRLKTLIPDSNISSNLELDGSDSVISSCGICLCDNSNAIRGEIDSCNHFFCFVCIMEWAKIESLCPMCKRRFSSIRRPPKHGVFSSERIVRVPKRDQVYHLFGNTTRQHFDPYAQVQCNVCRTAADECLLLLCDLCDSAAHTYCVGLGATVPEGDWFCNDCAVSRTEHDIIQKNGDDNVENVIVESEVRLEVVPHDSTSCHGVDSYDTSENCNDGIENVSHVSIFNIVRDADDPFTLRRRSSLVSSLCERQSSLEDDMSHERRGTFKNRRGQKTSQTDARTLSRCRDVHGYVRDLRENWDALRRGSLRFSSSSVESSCRSLAKCNTLAATQESSGQSQISSFTADQQLTIIDELPGNCTEDRHSDDAKKAWKMMAKAKSLHKPSRIIKSVHCVSTNQSVIGNAAGGSSSSHLSKTQEVETSGFSCFTGGKRYILSSNEKQSKKHISTKLKVQSNCLNLNMEKLRTSDSLPTTSGFSASLSSWKVQTSSQTNICPENPEQILQQNLRRVLSTVANQQIESSRLVPLVESVSASSGSHKNTKADNSASFSCKMHFPERDVKLENSRIDKKLRNNDNAKSEIQSLVKLNLKLLKGEKQLGVDVFKEVARLATHTILAACGFEHSRHVVHSFPRSVCSHSEKIEQLRKSTLMPNSCRECFFEFVKEVVNSVLTKKVSHANSSKVIP
ncbi:uncharacterized protein LOC126674020 [Mercurialis annua]|uniref:uncharacterized protein LOC126674020 n=1 Tax=Mercurialis annua TaxID=3986 RepID=UPI0024ADCD41|nr:uncharacterized protein LOC126674020 [Mercurialis annua]